MPAIILCTAVICFLIAYRYLGAYLEKLYDLHLLGPTPAIKHKTDRDYSPTPKAVVFGHHFASIAGAAPIIGPIVACANFGWLPTVLWIVLGSILMGGVHDFSSLAISLNTDGRSIGFVAQKLLGKPIGKLFSVFILLTMIYVLIVFLDLTATSFLPVISGPTADSTPIAGIRLSEQEKLGGIVASASIFLIISALVFGKLEKTRLRSHIIGDTLIALGFLSLSLVLAHKIPVTRELFPFLSHKTWILCLVMYALTASILPVNLLLQPRDFISSFLLYFCMIVGLLGIIVSTFTHTLPVVQPMLTTLNHNQLGSIFPALFITVSCGACSGFHSIVSSGSTSKQIAKVKDARIVGYGGMLTEGTLALIAAITFIIIPSATPMLKMSPPEIFSSGLGLLSTALGLPTQLGRLLGFLAISTFLLTTLDTATRLSRYVLAEILPDSLPKVFRTPIALSIACLLPVLLLSTRDYLGPNGTTMPLWKALWSLFGATNQLLGALAMCIAVLWLKRRGKIAWIISIGAIFLSLTTFLGLYGAIRQQLGTIKYIGISILVVGITVTFGIILRLKGGPPSDGTK